MSRELVRGEWITSPSYLAKIIIIIIIIIINF